ncbi:hypothetical protein DUI87_29323 [Hirundo rustica rustica]|uniref:Uncharacterized protein n=1 Tax=Hirundo rustica rustica TaxID=333673 RepID=A0A3M0J1B8_HIRRU|nr:hypothetical protein DUI87_29323 [Hirundo rustica rustica]
MSGWASCLYPSIRSFHINATEAAGEEPPQFDLWCSASMDRSGSALEQGCKDNAETCCCRRPQQRVTTPSAVWRRPFIFKGNNRLFSDFLLRDQLLTEHSP